MSVRFDARASVGHHGEGDDAAPGFLGGVDHRGG